MEVTELLCRMRQQIEEWSDDEHYDDWWRYQRDYADAAQALAERDAELAAKNEELARMREALAFYAQRRNWRAAGVYMCGHAPDSACAKDGGIRARAALGDRT